MQGLVVGGARGYQQVVEAARQCEFAVDEDKDMAQLGVNGNICVLPGFQVGAQEVGEIGGEGFRIVFHHKDARETPPTALWRAQQMGSLRP